jgi:glycosyltransferase involved in cell wall biosynthesis
LKKNSKKKLAYLGIKGLPAIAGADKVVEAIANNLSEEFDIYVYCSDSYSIDYRSHNIKLIKLRNLRGKHLSSFSLFLLSAFHALLFNDFDLVHVHNTDAGFIIPLLRIKYKVIGTSHGYPYKREKWSNLVKNFLKFSESIFFRFSNLITCVSKSLSKELSDKYKKGVYFIPNGIDEPNYAGDNSILEKFELKEKEYMSFAAGRVDPTKGCHILLEAFKNINKKIDIAVSGDFSHKPDYSEKLYKMADERVKFIPFIENIRILFSVIKKAKLFIFPSTHEAMSSMLLEVAALGVPIICSDIPENVDVLEKNTIYFISGDYKDLAKKIEFCLNNYDQAVKIANKAKKWVIKQYKWHDISEKYKNIYNSLIYSD